MNASTHILDVAERPVGLHDGLAVGGHHFDYSPKDSDESEYAMTIASDEKALESAGK